MPKLEISTHYVYCLFFLVGDNFVAKVCLGTSVFCEFANGFLLRIYHPNIRKCVDKPARDFRLRCCVETCTS